MTKFHYQSDYKKSIKVPKGDFILVQDEWGDYGYHTQFRLHYYDGVNTNYIGKVKIARNADKITIIPDVFESLGDDYLSLGTSLDYYKDLLDVCGENSENILESLRDTAWNQAISTKFESKSVYINSIIRDNSAIRAKRFGKAVIIGEAYSDDFDFSYTGQIPGAESTTSVRIEFSDDDDLPGRIVGIVGKNAVGKTQFLASLARDLVQIQKTSRNEARNKDIRFGGMRPIFTRVITVSYSAFDRFDRPKDKGITSYRYCGIRSSKNELSKLDLEARFKENVIRIIDMGREPQFKRFMNLIFDQESIVELEANESGGDAHFNEYLSALSSGQAIYAHFVASIISWIQPKSLIIFDEPETHLHPNAVANLFNSFSKILEQFDSYGIVATHSPVVIQEIPSKHVIQFIREDNITRAIPLNMESFGESISNITRHIFETIEIPNLYKKHLKRISKRYTYEECLKLFSQSLSFSAKSFLISQYMQNEEH